MGRHYRNPRTQQERRVNGSLSIAGSRSGLAASSTSSASGFEVSGAR